MEIFVQSRGSSPDFEYCWQPEVPPHLTRISSLIQSESPSVILARFDKKLILLATGLDSPGKKDFRNRSIRHSIAWVLDENYKNEEQIRAIAVQALKGLLASQVDSCIDFDDENGFKAKTSDIEEISRSLLRNKGIGTSPLPSPDLPPKIGKNSQGLRDDIAEKLQQYSLPKGCEFIVIATGVKSEDSLEKARAWRSLSNLVKSENWRELSRSEVQQSTNFLRAAITLLLVIVAIVLLLMLIHPQTQKPPDLPPHPSSNNITKGINAFNEKRIITQFIKRQHEIRSKLEKGVLSNEDRNLLQQVKTELKEHICSIEELENLSGESFD